MQGSSIICCSSNPLLPSLYFPTPQVFSFFQAKNQINSSSIVSFSSKLLVISSHIRPPSRFIINSAAAEELSEAASSASDFVETGYIYRVHGLQGEVRVKLSTDFPELRFSASGTRWLKQQTSGT